MPFNTKEKLLAYRESKKVPVKPCLCCGIAEQHRKSRKSQACSTCYKKYRNLYNLLRSAKYRADTRYLEFDLDIEWAIKQPSVCPKTGVKLTYSENGKDYSNRQPTAASIDKIDASKGYTKDNCAIVCWWYNVSKQQYDDNMVYKLCKQVVDTYEMKDAPSVRNQDMIEQEIT